MLAKFSAALGVLILALFALELGLRVIAPIDFLRPERPSLLQDTRNWAQLIHRPSNVPGLDYELVPGLDREARGMRVRTNSHGMRDDEPLPADTPGLLRIAVLGDSYAFGFGLAAEQGFAPQLEKLLDESRRAEGGRCDVLDFGTPGYSTSDEVCVLRSKVLDFEPDLVLVAYCLNDPETLPMHPLHRFFAPPRWWRHSELLRRIVRRERHIEMERLGVGDYFQFLHAREGEPWRSVVDGFAEMREQLASARIPGAIVIFPLVTVKSWADYPYRRVHEQVAQEAERNGLRSLDLLEAYTAHDPRELVIGNDDPHPSALGHRIAAEELARFLPPLLATAGR